MTTQEANDVRAYAHGLFPVTSVERLDSLAVMLLDFDNPRFAEQVLLNHSHESDVLVIPKVREQLNLDQQRQRESAKQRIEKVMQEVSLRRTTENALRKSVSADVAKVDANLAGFSPEDLEDLKTLVLASMKPDAAAFVARRDPQTSWMMRSLIANYLNTGGPAAPPPRRVASQPLAADFLEDVA